MSSRASPATARPAASPSSTTFVAARDVRKSFQVGDRQLEVLHGVSLEVGRGELVGLMGASGAGKSTLIQILGLLEEPTSGEVHFEGISAWKLPIAERARLRNERVGFVFQFYHLLPELTAVENVVLPAMIGSSFGAWRKQRKEHFQRAEEVLAQFGLGQRLKHRPAQLSGGERQRVAIARALFLDPPLLIADEPTGNLDSATGEKVLELLLVERERRGLSMLLVTHDERLATRCQRVVTMEDGRVTGDVRTAR